MHFGYLKLCRVIPGQISFQHLTQQREQRLTLQVLLRPTLFYTVPWGVRCRAIVLNKFSKAKYIFEKVILAIHANEQPIEITTILKVCWTKKYRKLGICATIWVHSTSGLDITHETDQASQTGSGSRDRRVGR